jgi:energy-coupling factor transport system substrate-specific component
VEPVSGLGRVKLTQRSGWLLAGLSLLGVLALAWPFLITVSASSSQAHRLDAPIELMVLVPLLLILCASEMARGSFDARGIAVLGILAACGTALRIPSPGVAGFEPVFFLLVLAGRVYGPSFGFALGGLTLFVSALFTGGVGPWLPFQMLAAGWVGACAGLLPAAASPRGERWLLAGYTAVACLLYGTVMNLWFWPFGAGTTTSISYVPGGSFGTNLTHFFIFDVTTSLGFDIPRAVINAVLILAVGGPVLVALRRGARRMSLVSAELEQPTVIVQAPERGPR